MIQKIFTIIGTHCISCKLLIERSLLKTEGIDKAVFDPKTEELNVTYDEKRVDLGKLRQVVYEAGYYTLFDPKALRTSNSSENMPKEANEEYDQCVCC